jgi:hypothetical protein
MKYQSKEEWEKNRKRKRPAEPHPRQMRGGGKIKAHYEFMNNNGELVFKGEDGKYYVVVDSKPHAVTDELEPLYSVENIELVNIPKDTGVSFMKKGGRTPKHNQKLDMKYQSQEEWEKKLKRKRRPRKHPRQK